METPIVSVIIPIYNTELYVEAAVRSIMNQTFKDIEIILVDDGSTDKSASVCMQLCAEDSRITFFHQKNSGPAVARNYGLSVAKGNYIYFMDSDDLLVAECLEECLSKCEADQLDFLFFDARSFSEFQSLSIPYSYERTAQLKDGIYKGIEILSILHHTKAFRTPPWLNFIKRQYLADNRIVFASIANDDELFSYLLYLYAEKVSFIPKVYFNRRLRPNSIMTSKFKYKNMNSYFVTASELLSYKESHFAPNTESAALLDDIVYRMLDAALYNARVLNFGERLLIEQKMLMHYKGYASLKSLLVNMCPWLVTLKAKLK